MAWYLREMLAHALLAMVVEGEVVSTTSRWTSDHSRIVTEATVRTPDGDVIVSQLGGKVGTLAMRVFHGDEPLVNGMRVAVTAHADMDTSLRAHLVVDRVKVNAYPLGFVRTGVTEGGKYLFWEGGCVYVTIDSNGTKELPGDTEFAVVEASIDEWNRNTQSCSYFQILVDEREDVEVGTDMKNVIKFRDATWCRPAIADDPQRCYSPDAAGLTTAVYVDDASSDRDGAIVDADIELNGAGDLDGGFAISHMGLSQGVGNCLSDLGNTLTHELGHLQGIEHTCRTRADPPRVDDEGNPVPSCEASLAPAITEATMYNFAECGETKKATLTQDDIDAVCEVYRLADDPGSCERVDESGCGCASSGEMPLPAGLSAVGFAFLVLRRRRGILRP